jgi:hypothetical protein
VAGRSVKLSGAISEVIDGAGCEGGQSVLIQRAATKNGTYRTLKTVRSSSSGAFSLTLKPARSSYYRARVVRTTTCLSATSPKVRAQVTRRA